jgi:rare lipoprotein A
MALKEIEMRKILFIFLFLFSINNLQAQTEGYACIYSKGLCGGPTASGEKLNCAKLTAAHKTFKLGSKVRVTNLDNSKSVIVRINDRGPYSKKLIIDLSPAAAKAIGLNYEKGITRVKIKQI